MNDNIQPSNLPPLAVQSGVGEGYDGFLSSDEWIGTDISGDELDFTEPYTSPRFLLSCGGTPLARMGNVQVVTGQSGNGKTLLISQMIAAVLIGEFGCLCYELSDIYPRPKVLLVDTEQSREDVIAVKNRIAELCGFGCQERHPNFRIFMLRETETALQRWRKTLKAIYETKPTVVILDGILDVVEDFNEQKMCAEIIFKCMQTATHYGAAMMCVLHQNPGSTKLIGHLGSAAMRKVTDIVSVTKDKAKGLFTVSQEKARGHADFEDWQFRVLPSLYGRPEQINYAYIGKAEEIPMESIEKWLNEGKDEIVWPATLSDIKRVINAHGGVKGNDLLQDCVTRLRNKRIILEQPKSKGQKYPKYIINS